MRVDKLGKDVEVSAETGHKPRFTFFGAARQACSPRTICLNEIL
jgi:hypothetical protein